jgi:hypothetical protein
MWLDVLNEIILWLKSNWFFLVALVVAIRYGKTGFKELIFNPLAGGNGKVQMDELAKGVILAVFILASYKDGNRVREAAYFSDSFYAILLAAICGIASIKPATNVLHNVFGKDKPKEETHE